MISLIFNPNNNLRTVLQSFLDNLGLPETKVEPLLRIDVIASNSQSLMNEIRNRIFGTFAKFTIFLSFNNFEIRDPLFSRDNLGLLKVTEAPRVKFLNYPNCTIAINDDAVTHVGPLLEHLAEYENCKRDCCTVIQEGVPTERTFVEKLRFTFQALLTQYQMFLLCRPYSGAPPSRTYGIGCNPEIFSDNREIYEPLTGRIRRGLTSTNVSGTVTAFRDYSETLYPADHRNVTLFGGSQYFTPQAITRPDPINLDLTSGGERDSAWGIDDDESYHPGDSVPLDDELYNDFVEGRRVNLSSTRIERDEGLSPRGPVSQTEVNTSLRPQPPVPELLPQGLDALRQPQDGPPGPGPPQPGVQQRPALDNEGLSHSTRVHRPIITDAADQLMQRANQARNLRLDNRDRVSNNNSVNRDNNVSGARGSRTLAVSTEPSQGTATQSSSLRPVSSVSGSHSNNRQQSGGVNDRNAVTTNIQPLMFNGQPIQNPIYRQNQRQDRLGPGPPETGDQRPGTLANSQAPGVRTVHFDQPQNQSQDMEIESMASNGLISEISNINQLDGLESSNTGQPPQLLPAAEVTETSMQRVTNITTDLLFLLNGAGSFPEKWFRDISINIYISETSLIAEVFPYQTDGDVVALGQNRVDVDEDQEDDFFNNDEIETSVYECLRNISLINRLRMRRRLHGKAYDKVILKDVKYLENTDAIELRFYKDRFIVKIEKDSSLMQDMIYLDENGGTGFLFNSQNDERLRSLMRTLQQDSHVVSLVSILTRLSRLFSLFGASSAESEDKLKNLSKRAFDHKKTKRSVTLQHPDALDQIGNRVNHEQTDGQPNHEQNDEYIDDNISQMTLTDRQDLGLNEPRDLALPPRITRQRGRGDGVTSDAGYAIYSPFTSLFTPLYNNPIYRFMARTGGEEQSAPPSRPSTTGSVMTAGEEMEDGPSAPDTETAGDSDVTQQTGEDQISLGSLADN